MIQDKCSVRFTLSFHAKMPKLKTKQKKSLENIPSYFKPVKNVAFIIVIEAFKKTS